MPFFRQPLGDLGAVFGRAGDKDFHLYRSGAVSGLEGSL
jgi:hypothetical protein